MLTEQKLDIQSQAGKHILTPTEAIDHYWLEIARGEDVEHPGGEDHILMIAQGREKRFASVPPP